MPIDVVRKVNPYLHRFMFNRSLVPIMIETERPAVPFMLELLTNLSFPITQRSDMFGFISTLARPEHIKAMALEDDVIMIHANMPKFALIKLPLINVDLPSPKVAGIKMNPFSMMQGTFPTMALQKLQDAYSEKFNTTFNTRNLVGANEANDEGISGRDVKLATIDTGIDPSHPQVSFGVTVKSTMVGQIADANGHGTHCLTTNSGKFTVHPLNKIEIMGVAHEATRYSYKCLGFIIGAGTTADVIKAMENAYEDGCVVMSLSLGSEDSQGGAEIDPECRVIKALTSLGVMIVVAAGNSGPDPLTINTPGICPEAITVGAMNPRTFQIADFSSRGPTSDGLIKPDVVAPGVDIYSGSTGLLDSIGDKTPDRYAVLSGTSMATPHIAGLCALLKQKYPEIASSDFKRMVERHNKEGRKNNASGWGLAHWSMFDDLERIF